MLLFGHPRLYSTMAHNLQESELDLLARIAHRTLNRDNTNNRISALIDTIHNSELFSSVWGELGQAVGLLNRHISGEEIQQDDPITLNYADDMKAAMARHHLTSLPSPDEILAQARTGHSFGIIRQLVRVFDKTNAYGFLTNYETERALAGEAMAVYGKLLLELHPELKDENVFGASTLEEMFAVLRFNGTDTQCFNATRDWFFEEEEGTAGVGGKGFSHSLVAKIKASQPQS